MKRNKAQNPVLQPAELAAKCTEYLDRCDALQRRPTWQGLAGFVNVTSEMLTGRLRDEPGGEASKILQKAADAISDRLQQRTDSMAVLSVKQPLYGGFLDRAQASGDAQISIVVTVGGKGEKEAADFGT